jgi:hypothetical protein
MIFHEKPFFIFGLKAFDLKTFDDAISMDDVQKIQWNVICMRKGCYDIFHFSNLQSFQNFSLYA